jgi:HEPN domain-containing protein
VPGKTVSEARPRAKDLSAKAREFLEEAGQALAESRFDAAVLNAVHAGISAADAVCVALAGLRSADPDHQRAVDLLGEVASASPEVAAKARQLRQLLRRKNIVEYESRRATSTEARDAVNRAQRLVEWAAEQVRAAKL